MVSESTNRLKSILKSEQPVSLERETVRALEPELPSSIIDRLEKGAAYNWEVNDGICDKVYFLRKFEYITKRVYREAGTTLLRHANDVMSIVEAAALWLMNTGDVQGNFRGEVAKGGNEFDLTSLRTDAFDIDVEDRKFSTGGAGDIDVIPRGGGTISPTDDEELWVIIGYAMTTDPEVVEEYRYYIDDKYGARHGYGCFDQLNQNDVGYFPENGFTIVFPDQNYDLNILAAGDAETDFFPVGFRIATHSVIDTNDDIVGPTTH